MDLNQRIKDAEQRFEDKQAEKTGYLQKADEAQIEMTKLMGEWRLLQDLLKEETDKEVDSIKDPLTITAKPARKMVNK